MYDFLCAVMAMCRFRGYLPQPVTLRRAWKWITQFDRKDRKYIRRLLGRVVYLPKATVKDILIKQNTLLMQRLATSGLKQHQLIYVQVDDAGSSSPVMLNILRDAVGLEQRDCHFKDSKDVHGIIELTADLGEGALIYVDDFVGSGIQLEASRNFTIKHVVGTFSEFVLAPTVCEEGRDLLDALGVEVFTGHLHLQSERPLHQECSLFDDRVKSRLNDVCAKIDSRAALGFMKLATMVVFYHNSTDNVPVLLRGNQNQSPYVGIFPRTTDLPISP